MEKAGVGCGSLDLDEYDLTYMVCHDGSKASVAALATVRDGLLKETDRLLVANVWNAEKEKTI